MSKTAVMERTEKEVQVIDNTPAAMIRMAVASGADLEKLEKCMELMERHERNQAAKAYNCAMADFKKNPPEINKNKQVSFGNTHYKHATLDNVVDQITNELSKHGLSATWRIHQNGAVSVTCRISHILGHFEETTLTAPADNSGSKNSIQAIASTVSYLERYTILAALGLATKEMDDDARSAMPKLDDGQLNAIRDLLIALGDETKEGAFAKWLGADRLEDVNASEFNRAKTALEAKIARKNGAK